MNRFDSTSVRATRPALTRPNDFFAFWSDALEALACTPAAPRLGVSFASPSGARVVPVRFRSLDGCDIQGFLVTRDRPGDTGPAARRPLVVSTHGYNSQCNPVLHARYAAASGADLFCFDVRGFGRSRAACQVDARGYVLTGLGSPVTSILRGAVCDYVRAAEVATLVQAGEVGDIVFHGRSFGGGLAVMAQAVAGVAAYLPVAVPTFGWAEGRRRLAAGGSGQEINAYLAEHPGETDAIMRTLSYFDTVNFADRVGCPALVGVGLRDDVVPAATVYAVINHMVPSPEVMELPVSHTEDLAERHWVEFDRRWTADVAVRAGDRSHHDAGQYSS